MNLLQGKALAWVGVVLIFLSQVVMYFDWRVGLVAFALAFVPLFAGLNVVKQHDDEAMAQWRKSLESFESQYKEV